MVLQTDAEAMKEIEMSKKAVDAKKSEIETAIAEVQAMKAEVQKEIEQISNANVEFEEVVEDVKDDNSSIMNDYAMQMEAIQQEMDQVRKELLELKEEKKQIEAEKKELSSRRELDADEIRIVEKQVNNSSKRQALREKIEAQKKYDSVMVKGKFLNQRAPGHSVKLPYMKYDTDLPKWWTLEHGQTYTIPRGFADQINEYYAKISYRERQGPIDNPDDPGSALDHAPIREQIYAFVPLTF